MFKQLLTTDFFQVVSDKAQKNIIKDDRNKYKEIFDETRAIIANDPIIILSNINTILKEKEPLENAMVIYTTHTRRTTTLITNHIHKKIGKLAQMRAIIPNEEYEIMYNLRGLIKLYNIERYKNIDIPDLLNAVKINNLYYFPPEIELMDIYHKLYLPNYYDDWNTLLQQEKLLYNIITKGTSQNKKEIKESKKESKEIKNESKDNCTTCKDKRQIDINNIKHLMLKFFDNENYVLIGDVAHKLINSKLSDNDNISKNIQIISENNIEQDYQNIVNYLSLYTKHGIYYKKKKLYIPKDNRIFKYTLFIKYPTITSSKGSRGIDKQFLDIYNCTEFELIPYIPKKHNNISLRVGNLFVQMRFLLIDLWLYRVLKYLKDIDDKVFNEKCLNIYTTMNTIKKLLPISFKDKYMGINYDEKIAQKISISENNIKKSSYYPELSMKKTKKYKLIATST